MHSTRKKVTMDLLSTSLPLKDERQKACLRIVVVGGGVAGIVTARVLKSQGFTNLTLYEANDSLSGVWSSGYPNFGIQTPGSLYEFPDKELPEPKDYKSGPEIKKYCEEYAEEHGLGSIVQLNTKVTSIERRKSSGSKKKKGAQWELAIVRKTPTQLSKWATSTSTVSADFVILATGIYSPDYKYIPHVKGIEHFRGTVCHSEDYATKASYETDNSSVSEEGLKVVVVGFGKSAHDTAINAFSDTRTPPVLLFRTSHTCVPRKVLGLIPMEWLIYSRFGQGTLPAWQHCGPVEWFIQTFLYYPLIWFYWRLVELFFTVQHGMYGKFAHLRPDLPIEDDMYCGHGIIAHPAIFPMIRKGEIEAIKGSIEKVLPSGELLLTNGETIEADKIVFATGFNREYDFMPKELIAKKEHDGFYAYRNMIVPGVPDIAFLNSNVTTFSNITTPGLQAAWIAELLQGNLSLPKPEELLSMVESDKAWRRRHLKHAGSSRAYLIQLHQIRYWDSLLCDMGINVKRKQSKLGPLVRDVMNLFFPVCCSDYKTVITGEWKLDRKEQRQKNYTPSFFSEWITLSIYIFAIAFLMSIG